MKERQDVIFAMDHMQSQLWDQSTGAATMKPTLKQGGPCSGAHQRQLGSAGA